MSRYDHRRSPPPLPPTSSYTNRSSTSRRPRLPQREEQRDGEHRGAERGARERGELLARVPGAVRRGEREVARGGEDERERGRGRAAGDLEEHAEVAGDECDC